MRVACLIDGFNLYHAIDGMGLPRCKWCNYRQLARQFILPHQNLKTVVYFTAYANWRPSRAERHEKFVAALQGYGVETILGRFKEVTRHCRKCNQKYIAHEEKETDVNLATRLLHMAHLDEFDTALVISADSDYAAAIKLVTDHFPNKKVGVVFPVGQKRSDALSAAATFVRYMKNHHIQKSLLPDRVELKSGRVVTRPEEFT